MTEYTVLQVGSPSVRDLFRGSRLRRRIDHQFLLHRWRQAGFTVQLEHQQATAVWNRARRQRLPADQRKRAVTKVREILSRVEDLPVEFSRPEVAKILMGFYQSQK